MFLRFAGFIVSIVAGVVPLVCNASAPVSIIGVNREGYTIMIDTESDPLSVFIWKENENWDLRLKSTIEFKNEPCVFNDTSFVCAKDGKSPLAGTTYVRQKNVKDITGCVDPQFIYTCTSGCDKSKSAPNELTQDHPEGCSKVN